MRNSWIAAAPLIALACGAVSGSSGEDSNRGGSSSTGGGSGGETSGTGVATGGSGATLGSGGSLTGTGSSLATGGSGPATGGSDSDSGGSGPSLGGTRPAAGGGGGAGVAATGGSGTATGGSGTATGGSGTATGGSGTATGGSGTATGGTAGSGTAGSGGAVAPAYAPRTGSFKMLAYSATKGFRHDSIAAGQKMLQDIGKEQGFEVTVVGNDPSDPSAPNRDITAAGLAQYEIVFFMNTSGNIFNDTEQAAFEDWITTKNGAFGGVHSATDTESGWLFYQEMTGQYNDLHDQVSMASIQWQPDALTFIAVRGLPNPWLRNEEWFNFSKYQDWSSKAGFKILSTVTPSGGVTRPVSYIREWGNFRAFYTSLGHETVAFQDDNVKKHVAAGIMWAVRREALFKTN